MDDVFYPRDVPTGQYRPSDVLSREVSAISGTEFSVNSGMNTEIKIIIANLEEILSGEPWYGRSVYALLDEVNPSLVHAKPANNQHSLADLLYHMLTWAEFTLAAVQERPEEEMHAIASLDWREVTHPQHGWHEGVKAFKEKHAQLIKLLQTKDDSLLNLVVPARKYNYRVLLNGLIQHNIYHIGQVAYRMKEIMV